jgi:hypothetical protein
VLQPKNHVIGRASAVPYAFLLQISAVLAGSRLAFVGKRRSLAVNSGGRGGRKSCWYLGGLMPTRCPFLIYGDVS